jgi:dihydroorotase
MEKLILKRPDDFHLHLRDEARMNSIVADSARQFGRAIIMPNLTPPVTTVKQALQYRERILAVLPKESMFQPLMTIYLTDKTKADEIKRLADSEHVYAVKLYPSGATTHSEAGVTAIEKVYPVLDQMQDLAVPLLVHGEVTAQEVDHFDREAVFIERILQPLLERYPGLKVVFEHITTKEAVDFVNEGPDTIAATITPQHLMFNRNQLFNGGFRAHNYCLPLLKRERHRRAVLDAAISGHPGFFLGTDSAPHDRREKETACGCAGIYSAHSAMELYAQVFEDEGALDRLEAFSSQHGAEFYGLPQNQDTVTLVKQDWQIPESIPFGEGEVVPMLAGETLRWKFTA